MIFDPSPLDKVVWTVFCLFPVFLFLVLIFAMTKKYLLPNLIRCVCA